MTVSGLYSWSSGIQGHYNLTVPTSYANGTSLTKYVAVLFPSVVGANGTLTAPVNVVFVPEEQVNLALSGDGTVSSTYNKAPSGTSVWAVQGSSVQITATAYPGWTFSGWEGIGSGSCTGPNATYDVTANGPINEVALFTQVVVQQAPTYTVTFSLGTPIATGTTWGVTLGGLGYSTTASTLVVTDVSATTYALQVNTATAPSGLAQYRATSSDPVALTVRSNVTISVSYDPYYFVAVSASVGGTVSPGAGWYASGSVLYLVAAANSSDTFASWAGSGTGSYTGGNATASVIVTGPITEVATFQSNHVGAAGTSIWSNPATWAGFGGAALVIGIAIGAIVSWFANRDTPQGDARRGTHARPAHPPREVRSDPSCPPRRRWAQWIAVIALAAVFALGPAGSGVGSAHAAGSPSTPVLAAPSYSGRIASPLSFQPIGIPNGSQADSSGPGTFYNATPLPNPSLANATCIAGSCFSVSNDVTVNTTRTGLLAVVYTSLTDQSPCPALRPYSVSNIAFLTSSNEGQSWSPIQYLGNSQCSPRGAGYPDAWEPSLTSLGNGTLVLVYVEYNLTAGALPPLTPYSWPPVESRLVLTESYDNGSTWTPPQVLNISNPASAPPGLSVHSAPTPPSRRSATRSTSPGCRSPRSTTPARSAT